MGHLERSKLRLPCAECSKVYIGSQWEEGMPTKKEMHGRRSATTKVEIEHPFKTYNVNLMMDLKNTWNSTDPNTHHLVLLQVFNRHKPGIKLTKVWASQIHGWLWTETQDHYRVYPTALRAQDFEEVLKAIQSILDGYTK